MAEGIKEKMPAAEKDVPQRTEEVQHIIDRMPSRFGMVITLVVLFTFVLMLLFGWLIRYPDVVTGEISINATQAPIKLVAANSGKLQLAGLQSQDRVDEGQVVAWLENPAILNDVTRASVLTDSLLLPTQHAQWWYEKFPKNLNLGELNSKYFTLLNALKQLADYQVNRLYDKQLLALDNLLQEQRHVMIAAENKAKISKESQDLINRQGSRDSQLYDRKVLSAAEMDRSNLTLVGAKDHYESAKRDVASAREQIGRTQSQMQELRIQQSEKEQQLDLDLLTAFNDFRDNLTSWKQRYLFRAPFRGQVQFLNFWSNNQFIQAGEEVFTIVPEAEAPIGQVILPAIGAGKVEVGQEVIVKLDNYPYMEYGSITGLVETISLTTNAIQSEQGSMETYLVSVSFPDQLETNYGSQLGFKHEIKGTAEIITRDRRLIQRFFDNLKYIVKR